MRSPFLLSTLIFLSILARSQAPQFAVVRPDGTTYLCPTWDSAYNTSQNGDNIYLPGGTFITSSEFIISKRLFIYGAGHHPDSSSITGVTTFLQPIRIIKGADQGILEGVNFLNAVYFGTSIAGNNKANVQQYTIKNCNLSALYFSAGVNSLPADSLPSNILITDNILGSAYPSPGPRAVNNIFAKNIITGALSSFEGCSIDNNIFLSNNGVPFNDIVNCSLSNNIFCSPSIFSNMCGNIFWNNLKVGSSNLLSSCAPGHGNQYNTITVTAVSDIFISYAGNGTFSYTSNFHLKPTCPGVNAGTDGTDVGIYGTASPAAAGWVPTNPHIYFKQVSPVTNSGGQLPVQIKVRTTN
jgi:hypothetical protein